MGNLTTAEAHLEGLLALVELDESGQFREDPSHDTAEPDSDMLGRFISICINETMSLKSSSMLADSTHRTIDTTCATAVSQPRYTRESVAPMSQLVHRLLSLWMVPFFLADNANLRTNDFNGAEYLSSRLRHCVEKPGGCRVSGCQKQEPDVCQGSSCSFTSKPFLASGDQLSIHYLWGLSYNGNAVCPTNPSRSTVASGLDGTPTAIDGGAPPILPSEASYYNCSWLTCAITVGIYMYVVVNVPWSLEAIAGRRLRWVLRNLCRDIKRTQAASECYVLFIFLQHFLGVTPVASIRAHPRSFLFYHP
jgi:hypothetical protein